MAKVKASAKGKLINNFWNLHQVKGAKFNSGRL
jgi:hypothetical protein